MYKYSIEIPNNRLTAYRVVAGIVLFLNTAMFFIVSDGKIEWKHDLMQFLAWLNLAGVIDVYFLETRKKKYPFVFFANAIAWLIFGKYLIGILMLLFAIMSLNALKDLVIKFSDEGILYPSFPEKLFPWADVSFVKLKDDILTIDLKNNQLLQFTLMPEAAEGLDVKEFNESMREWVSRSMGE